MSSRQQRCLPRNADQLRIGDVSSSLWRNVSTKTKPVVQLSVLGAIPQMLNESFLGQLISFAFVYRVASTKIFYVMGSKNKFNTRDL